MQTSSDRADWRRAQQVYAAVGVDAQKAIDAALAVPVSMHCWQVDDVRGFEVRDEAVGGGGLLATGSYPGRARNPDEARADLEKVLKLTPGVHRLNVHACYAETGAGSRGRVDRDELRPEHFARWMDWGRQQRVKLDFNPTFFAHPMADAGYTLSSTDAAVRRFWVRHAIACRKIGEAMARRQGGPCLVNHWIPDGEKDFVADRWTHRELLTRSLDEAIANQKTVDKKRCVDFVESKLFGLGSEEYVVGSAEYYSSYALSRGIGFCLDMGHWHPTEEIYDKISAFLQFHRRLLLHVSRPVQWDSDHVVVFNDPLRRVFLEVQRGGAWGRVAVATDYFDASINRIAAYVIGLRATRKAILFAMLDPSSQLARLEQEGKRAARLALMDEMSAAPFGAVWNQLCHVAGAAPEGAWMKEVSKYESAVLSRRG